jgi:site-specific DNA recombinase
VSDERGRHEGTAGRDAAHDHAGRNIGFARRPQYLFSGLSKGGVCGGGFIMTGRNRLACFGAREKGTCDNRLTIRRDEVEARVARVGPAATFAPDFAFGFVEVSP